MSVLQEHLLECDILVAGGGPAGIPCAIASARNGAKVILCHDRSVLGGNASSEVRMHICGADGSRRGIDCELEAREGGIMEEIRLETSIHNPQRSASMLDLILYEKCRNEPNLTLLLNTTVTGVSMENNRITHALAERPSTEDRFQIKADIFIDCTGDGRLGAEAGADFRRGREATHEFNEKLAQPTADSKSLGSTLLLQAKNMGKPTPFIPPTWARKFSEEDLRLRPHATGGHDRGIEYGYWWVEWGGCLDTIKDNEKIRDELLRIILGVWDHIKNSGNHGAENWALDWFGFVPGKRESRRFLGQYVLNENDLIQSKVFDDSIAYGGWPIDTHPPEGVDAPHLNPCEQHKLPYLYDIPLRACVSRNIPNLMFAGRNISATHIAFASTRVMATCAVMGQGVGTAAASAIREKCQPSELYSKKGLLKEIQQQLLRDDCFLIGQRNEDAKDLAKKAIAAASSEQANGTAQEILSGQTRSVHGPRGVSPERSNTGTHRWMSNPAQGLPAWIELRWPEAIQSKEIQLIFDSGLHRFLTLSHSDGFAAKMKWGQAQPETVQDYKIEGLQNSAWKTLVNVTQNYQRRRVHALPPESFDAIRVTVLATNGLDHARICEIRVMIN